jgi:hypothetical protein
VSGAAGISLGVQGRSPWRAIRFWDKRTGKQRMAFIFFTVPIQDCGRAQEELNAFLRSHKILSV